MTTANSPQIGSVSSGTLKDDDLYPVLIDLVREYGSRKWVDALMEELADPEHPTEDEYEWLMSDLFDALQECSPLHCYFGAHPGDGADFGFWPNWDYLEHDFGYDEAQLKVSDLSEVPDGFSGEVLEINDRGNATLYVSDRGKLREQWAIV